MRWVRCSVMRCTFRAGGLHVVAYWRTAVDDRAVARMADLQGLSVQPLNDWAGRPDAVGHAARLHEPDVGAAGVDAGAAPVSARSCVNRVWWMTNPRGAGVRAAGATILRLCDRVTATVLRMVDNTP